MELKHKLKLSSYVVKSCSVQDFINRRKMTQFGNMALVEEREEYQGGNVAIRLPGVRSGDMAARSFKPEVRVHCLQFSPTGNCTLQAFLADILCTRICILSQITVY